MTDLDEYGGKRSWKKQVWDVGSPSAAYTVTSATEYRRHVDENHRIRQPEIY